MAAYLQHQLWAIEQATQAEMKYDTALLSMISCAKDERRTVRQESNGARRRCRPVCSSARLLVCHPPADISPYFGAVCVAVQRALDQSKREVSRVRCRRHASQPSSLLRCIPIIWVGWFAALVDRRLHTAAKKCARAGSGHPQT